MNIIELIRQPWTWYVSGIAIGLIFLALMFSGKTFAFSSNLRSICSMLGAGRRVKFFEFDWRNEVWNLLFLLGAIAGGFVAWRFLSGSAPPQVSSATVNDLQKLGFVPPRGLEPPELYCLHSLTNIKTVALLVIGDLLIGFGTRWAGGCTSGHAITGLSERQLPSLIAVAGFFIGGLIMTHLLFPIIFG